MRSLKRFFSLVGVIVFTLTLFSGCNPFDNGSTAYLTKKMDEIPIEFDGYEFSEEITSETSTQHFQGVVEFNGSMLEIQYQYNSDDGNNYDYLIKYKDKSWFIDDEFMREKSETYVNISHIWRDFKDGYDFYQKSNILGVYIFDGHLFIITDGIIERMNRTNCCGSAPITLYFFDLKSEKVFYAGYYQKYIEQNVALSIIKKEKASNEK